MSGKGRKEEGKGKSRAQSLAGDRGPLLGWWLVDKLEGLLN